MNALLSELNNQYADISAKYTSAIDTHIAGVLSMLGDEDGVELYDTVHNVLIYPDDISVTDDVSRIYLKEDLLCVESDYYKDYPFYALLIEDKRTIVEEFDNTIKKNFCLECYKIAKYNDDGTNIDYHDIDGVFSSEEEAEDWLEAQGFDKDKYIIRECEFDIENDTIIQ